MTGFPPIPASAFLLDHLLGLLFIAHILCMNFVAIAPFIVAWYLLVKGRSGVQRAAWTGAALPVAYTLAINFGVACLLFVQVLFPENFFTANILLGGRWLAVIGLLLVSYYGVYVVNGLVRRDRVPLWIPALISLLNGALVWAIGYVMISNYFASTNSASWPDYLQNPSAISSVPTFAARSLHFLVGAIAVTGFWMMWIASWRTRSDPANPELEKYNQQGNTLATAATGLQVIVGIWYLLSLPATIWDKLFSGGFASLVWISGVGAGLVLVVVLALGNLLKNRRWQWASSILLGWTLMGMISGRELIRLTSFGADFNLRNLPQASQGSVQTIFAVALLAALSLIAALLIIVRRAKRP
jgi:hypothetical protein